MKIDVNVHVASFVRGAKSSRFIEITGDFTFVYDYPLSTKARFHHTFAKKTSAGEILELVAGDYRCIYATEAMTTKKAIDQTPGMLNRNTTDGVYGIWGHGIEDLFVEAIIIDVDKREVTFAMGS